MKFYKREQEPEIAPVSKTIYAPISFYEILEEWKLSGFKEIHLTAEEFCEFLRTIHMDEAKTIMQGVALIQSSDKQDVKKMLFWRDIPLHVEGVTC